MTEVQAAGRTWQTEDNPYYRSNNGLIILPLLALVLVFGLLAWRRRSAARS